MKRKQVENCTILLGLSGSRAYGTFIEGVSDYEYKGICIPPKDYWLGFKQFEQKDSGWATEEGIFSQLDRAPDSVIYSLKKYLSLATNANPNILELLFLEDYQYSWKESEGIKLIENRNLFLTKKVKYSYSG